MSKPIQINGGLLWPATRLACKHDWLAMWEPTDRGGDARNADPRVIVRIGKTPEEAEIKAREALA